MAATKLGCGGHCLVDVSKGKTVQDGTERCVTQTDHLRYLGQHDVAPKSIRRSYLTTSCDVAAHGAAQLPTCSVVLVCWGCLGYENDKRVPSSFHLLFVASTSLVVFFPPYQQGHCWLRCAGYLTYAVLVAFTENIPLYPCRPQLPGFTLGR